MQVSGCDVQVVAISVVLQETTTRTFVGGMVRHLALVRDREAYDVGRIVLEDWLTLSPMMHADLLLSHPDVPVVCFGWGRQSRVLRQGFQISGYSRLIQPCDARSAQSVIDHLSPLVFSVEKHLEELTGLRDLVSFGDLVRSLEVNDMPEASHQAAAPVSSTDRHHLRTLASSRADVLGYWLESITRGTPDAEHSLRLASVKAHRSGRMGAFLNRKQNALFRYLVPYRPAFPITPNLDADRG